MINSQDLLAKNRWWEENSYRIVEAEWAKRDLYNKIAGSLSHPLMLNIVGLRRVGKSTILKQLVGHLLAEEINPKNIFYYLFDYASQPQKEEFLDEILSIYFQEILKKPKYSVDEKIYILLDEIQYIDNWQSVLKRYYDLSGKKIKFILTGSQSLLLKGKYRESLAGRIFDFYLYPMSFREFLRINKESVKITEKFDLFNFPEVFSDLGGYNVFFSQSISDLSKEYIIAGQFPEMRNIEQIEQKHDYIIDSVLGKVLDDCVHMFNIEKTEEFKLIARHLLNNISSIFELKNIGGEAGISFMTMEKYVEYLKNSYVVEVLYRYHKSLIKQGRLLKKIYSPCVNFICALNHFNLDHFNEVPQVFGKIIENAVYNVLKQKYKIGSMDEPISFWRKGEKEIDFIVTKDGKQLPIEVKFSNNINLKDLKVLSGYVEEKKLEYGVVVTRNELDKKEINGQTLYFIPYYLILMMV